MTGATQNDSGLSRGHGCGFALANAGHDTRVAASMARSPQYPAHGQHIAARCLPASLRSVFTRHRRQCRLHMPYLQQNGLKSCLRQPGMQPL
jgi:hypothetical protein